MSITAGDAVTLKWDTTNATSVTITATAGGQTTQLPISTSPYTDHPQLDTTYTATATGPTSPPAIQPITVHVVQPVPPQITTFTANPSTILAGQPTTLTWATTNATSVNITPSILGDNVIALATSGHQDGVVVQQTTSFTITAAGPGGNAMPHLNPLLRTPECIFPAQICPALPS